ncbi:MAG: hypothetical protein ACOC3Y_02260 [Desulfohalobiaceae bacterium]
MFCAISPKMSEQDLSAIQSLEQELDRPVLALTCQQTPPAQLTAEQVQKLQEMENKLGITLLAVEPQTSQA